MDDHAQRDRARDGLQVWAGVVGDAWGRGVEVRIEGRELS
jgi:hypothetical protein